MSSLPISTFLSETFPPSEEGLSQFWNCFCSGYSWSRDGIRRMGKLVHKSRPQQLCLVPTSVLLGQLSKAKLECSAYKSVPIKSRKCTENIKRQKLQYIFLLFLCEHMICFKLRGKGFEEIEHINGSLSNNDQFHIKGMMYCELSNSWVC